MARTASSSSSRPRLAARQPLPKKRGTPATNSSKKHPAPQKAAPPKELKRKRPRVVLKNRVSSRSICGISSLGSWFCSCWEVQLLKKDKPKEVRVVEEEWQQLSQSDYTIYNTIEFDSVGVLGFWGDRKSTRLNSSHRT